MQKFKSYVLPIAIVLGLLLHRYCAMFSVAVPYIIFSILLLTFSAVDVKKLKYSPLFFWILGFQIVMSIGLYYLLKVLASMLSLPKVCSSGCSVPWHRRWRW